MKRAQFAVSIAGVLAVAASRSARAALDPRDDIDPATTSTSQALRVLLGTGAATPLAGGGGFTYEGRTYRGDFARTPDGRVVSTVPLEAYLYSVVPREMPSSWPVAALQAQAICARTYVLQRSNPLRAYDVVPSELDQVYGGVSSETPAGRAAVDATANQVLRFADGFAEVLYSSCCGGHTEASSEVWGGIAFPYLGGVSCPYCIESPDYRWQRDIPSAAIEQAFARELEPFGALRELRVSSSDGSGRARMLELVSERGSTLVKGSSFRLRVGARAVRSLLITKVAMDRQTGPQAAATVHIEGSGLGHGVGLCQWGARGMANAGSAARDILAQYFPGTQLGRT